MSELNQPMTPDAKSPPPGKALNFVAGMIGDLRKNSPAPARYQRQKLLGEGGLGKVWLAFDRRLDREVALKELRPEVADNPLMRRRFLREARIASKLQHPSIISIHDVADAPSGELPYFSMPVAPGGTLEFAIRAYHANRQGLIDRRGLRRLLQIFVTVCQAIDYAHSQGVIHRDLKPANIALGAFGEVLVLDWGLGRILSQSEEADSAFDAIKSETIGAELTHDGDVLGTPAYMAPEQALGQRDAITVRADVYSLGAILFNILTGETPRQRVSATSGELIQLIAASPIPSARTINSKTPAELEAVCAKALAVDQGRRYATAGELAAEVSRWLSGDAVAALPESLPKRIARLAARHSATTRLIAGGVGVLLVAGITIAVLVWMTFREMIAEHIRDQSQLSAQIAARLTDFALFQRSTVAYVAEKEDIRELLVARNDNRPIDDRMDKHLNADLVALMSTRLYWRVVLVCDASGRTAMGAQRDRSNSGAITLIRPSDEYADELAPFLQLAKESAKGTIAMMAPATHLGSSPLASPEIPERICCGSFRDRDGRFLGAVIVSIQMFDPSHSRYEFAEELISSPADIYLADSDGTLIVPPAVKTDWASEWRTPGLLRRHFPELEPIFNPANRETSMAVLNTGDNQIVTAAASVYDPRDRQKRIVVVAVSSYDDIKMREVNILLRAGPPLLAAIIFIVAVSFIFGWLVTRSAND